MGDRERAPDKELNPIKPLMDFASREIKYIGSGQAFKDLELRKNLMGSLVELLAATLIF